MAALAQIGLTSTPMNGIEHAGGDRHAQGVVDEREEQVLPDIPHRRAAETSGADDRARSPLTSVIPALSMATSVPVPIAMPTAASASAGASLTPSPAIATTRPSCCSRRTTSRFWSGRTPAMTSSMPSVAADRASGGLVVAGQHDDPQAVGVQQADRLRRRGLDRIGDGEKAREPSIDRSEHHRLATLPTSVGFGRERRRLPHPDVRAALRCRAMTRRLVNHSRSRLHRSCDSKPAARGHRRARSLRAPPTMAAGERMLARLLESGRQAEHVRLPRTGDDCMYVRERRLALPSACPSCRRRACRPSRGARALRRS